MIESKIKFSQIEYRLDADYYKSEYLYNEELLRKCDLPVKTIREISNKIVDGPFGSDLLKSEYVEKGIPLFRVQNVTEEYIDMSDFVYINREKQNKLKRSKVQSGDLVITKAGRVGTTQVVPEEIPEANITSHLAKIELKKEYNPYYIAQLLNSKIGRLQIERQGIKSTKPELNIDEVAITKIPVPSQTFQQKIERLIKEADQKRIKAEEKYREAEELLEKELGLDKLDLSNKQSYEVRFSEIEDRLGSRYYQPKYKKIDFKKTKVVIKTTKEICCNIVNGQYFDVYLSSGIPYVRVTDITSGEIMMDDIVFIHPEIVNKAKLAKEGDVITARVGSIGFSAVIPRELNNCAVSDNLIKLTLKEKNDVDPHYLAFYFNSKVGKEIMSKLARGGVQQRLNQTTLEILEVPILPIKIQKEIAEYCLAWLGLRKESRELIHRAKKEVEDMVEKGAKNG